jgi:hypothetical protein
MNKTRFLVICGMVFTAALSRLVPHPYNFTPICAMSLFAGAYLANARLALAIPLLAMLLSDAILGFHGTMPFVYAAFALVALIGIGLQKHRSTLPVLAATLSGSVLFFVITNFGVWAVSGMYSYTWQGLATCYVAAVPFFHYTLLGDLFYVAALFGSFAWLEQRIPALQQISA